jgi:hypothetical protein
MGQRHQIFIKTINPYHAAFDKKKKAELKKMFGTNKTTVFVFHNQWLYGRSALLSALNVLEFNDGLTSKERRMGNVSAYNNPFTADAIRVKSFDHIKTVMEAVLNLVREDNDYRGKGWLGSFLINDIDPELRESFDEGDNNDGVTIIDAIENKYCFMNISDYERGRRLGHNSRDLSYLKPSTGKQYVEAYNPSTKAKAKCSFYGKEAIKEGEFESFVKETRATNNGLVKRLKKFDVLTEAELRKIFRKFYAIKDAEEKKEQDAEKKARRQLRRKRSRRNKRRSKR